MPGGKILRYYFDRSGRRRRLYVAGYPCRMCGRGAWEEGGTCSNCQKSLAAAARGKLLCLHCHHRLATAAQHGLCQTCLRLPGSKELYGTGRAQFESLEDETGYQPLPPAPTLAQPGTEEKIRVMCQRAESKCQLHHPDDVACKWDSCQTPTPAARLRFAGGLRFHAFQNYAVGLFD